MTAPTKWRINVTANNEPTYALGIGGLELRSTVGVARPFVRDFFTVNATNTGAANILGAASLTAIVSAFEAYTWHQVTFPFAVIVGGVSYTTCVVTSDGQITFGEDGNMYGWDYNQVENYPKYFPSIIHSPGNDSGFSGFKKLYAGAENGGTTFRIRLEMLAQDTDTGGAADTVWEVTFAAATPNHVRLDFQSSAYAAGAQGLIAGISDGYYRAYAATFGAGVVNQGYDVNFAPTTAEGTATASSTNPPDSPTTPYGLKYGAEQACDNTVDTYWMAASGNATGWLQYEFNAPFAVAEYVLSAPSHLVASATGFLPKDWTLEYWDGAGWVVADTQTNQTSWGYTEARTFSLTPPPSNDGAITLSPLTLDGMALLPPGTYLGGDLALLPLTLSGLALLAPAYAGAVNLGDAGNQGGSFVATPLTLSGNSMVGSALNGDIAWAQPTLAGSLEGPLPLPLLTLAAAGHAGTIAAAAIALLPLTLAGGIDGPLALPLLALSGSVIGGAVGDGDALLLPLTANGAGIVGFVGNGDVTLPLLDAEGGPEGAVVLPLLAAAGAGVAGNAIVGGDLALQPLAGNASTAPDNAVLLPLLATAGTVLQGAIADGNILLPLLTAEAGPVGESVLLPLTLAGDAVAGTVGAADLLLDKFTLTATAGPAQNLLTGDSMLPWLTSDGVLLAGTMSDGDAVLGLMTVAATAGTGILADGDVFLPALSVNGTAYADGIATGDVVLSEWIVYATGDTASVGQGAVQFSALTMSGTAFAGSISTGTLTLPLMTVSSDGHADTVGTATIELPLLSLDATGITGVVNPVFTGVVLNTHTKAVSTYSGLAFNSMANFNGLVLAATSTGIVALVGDNDNGTPIEALIAGGVSDLKSEQFKRVLCGYAGYRASGTLELTMITDEHHEYVYSLLPRRINQAHASRVKFGRGVDGRYWQWKLANKAGADFALDTLTLDATPLSRRIG